MAGHTTAREFTCATQVTYPSTVYGTMASMNGESPHADAVNGSRDGPAGPSPVPGPPRMRQVLDAIPPASGAIVMASGIVSIDLYSDHQPVLSAILLWFAAGVWLLLAIMLGMRSGVPA